LEEEIYKQYFSDDFYEDTKPQELKTIKELSSDNMVMVCGDFYGIQKFIFERLATKNASKVLRAKSAFIQIFTIYIAKYICHRLKIDEKYILSATAGKFEVVALDYDEVIINDIQNKLNEYFIPNYALEIR